jgi:hypothetical protein
MLSPPFKPRLHSAHPSSMRTRAADRLYLGTGGAAPEVPADKRAETRPPPAGQRTSLRGPLRPHASPGGIPEVVGSVSPLCRRLRLSPLEDVARVSGGQGPQYRRQAGRREAASISRRNAANRCPAVLLLFDMTSRLRRRSAEARPPALHLWRGDGTAPVQPLRKLPGVASKSPPLDTRVPAPHFPRNLWEERP